MWGCGRLRPGALRSAESAFLGAEHIAPTRRRADVVVRKGGDHGITDIHLRLP